MLYKNNLVHSADSELYHMSNSRNQIVHDNQAYDPLNRLTDFARGTLSSSGYNGTSLDTVVNASISKEWSLDVLGNWTSHNDQNQLTNDHGETIKYDANGNLVEDDYVWVSYTYDAWNRQVKVGQPYSESVSAVYGYDALGRRISQGDGSTSTSLYYSAQGQVIEERNSSGDTTGIYYWSPAYVDGMIERVRDSDGNGTLDEHLFAVQDANWNTTALVNTSGDVVERYLYDPYGSVTYLNADWTTKSTQASSYDWDYLFQGKRLDTNTGQYDSRARVYDPATGRFDQEDPDGYVNGANLYQLEGGNPLLRLDPMGTVEGYAGNGQGGWNSTTVNSRPSRPKPSGGTKDVAIEVDPDAKGKGGKGGKGGGMHGPGGPGGNGNGKQSPTAVTECPTQCSGSSPVFLNLGISRLQRAPIANSAFRINRWLGSSGSPASDLNPITHTFVFTTDKYGRVRHTYSWGNARDVTGWNKDQAEDIKAAKLSLAAGLSWDDYVGTGINDDIELAFTGLSAQHHWNFLIAFNCKGEANNLVNYAIYLLGQGR